MASMGMPPGMMVQQPPVVPNTHPQQHHQHQQQIQVQTQGAVNPHPPHPHPPPQQPPQQTDDPITKFKASLLPRLKESLFSVFKIGSHLYYQNANQDETGIHFDKINGRFEETMEEFYAICDQIELQLRLAQEIVQQDKDSRVNTPISVMPSKADTTQSEGHLYSQYISTVRAQISCAKDIRDLLHDGLNFSDHSHS